VFFARYYYSEQSRIEQWAAYAARMGKMRIAFRLSVGKFEGKGSVWRQAQMGA
jgi:hypothetical protein